MVNYGLNTVHLYRNLINIYDDNGNLLMLKCIAEEMGVSCHTEIVSIYKPFDADKYDLILFDGGQGFEQLIISEDIQKKKDSLINYIENDSAMLAVCGDYQLLDHCCMGANGEKIQEISALDCYTLSQENDRFIGDIVTYSEKFNEIYYGFEDHNSWTLLGEGERPSGKMVRGQGNNGEDQSESVVYRSVLGSYLHGLILARNENLAARLIRLVSEQRYGGESDLPYPEG